MNSRRGSTLSPISTRNSSSAARGVFHGDLQQRAVGRVERGDAEFLGVHFAQALEPGDLQALFARRANGRQQAAEIVQAGRRVAAAELISGFLDAGPLLRQQGVDLETHLAQLGQLVVDRADFVQFDDVQPARPLAVAVAVRAFGRRSPTSNSSPDRLFLLRDKLVQLLARGEPVFVVAEEDVVDRQSAGDGVLPRRRGCAG